MRFPMNPEDMFMAQNIPEFLVMVSGSELLASRNPCRHGRNVKSKLWWKYFHLSRPNDWSRESHQNGGDIDWVCVEVEVLWHVEHVQQGRDQHGDSGPEDHHEGGRQPAVEGKENVDYSTPANINSSQREEIDKVLTNFLFKILANGGK